MVGRKRVGQDHLVGAAVGAVLALALLVLHDAALGVEFLLADRAEQVAHAVGLHPQGHVERGGRHGLEIVGAVEPGGAVHVGRADLLERFEIGALVVFRTGKHQVLEQVRKAGLAGRFVGRADVVPDAHGDDRRLVVLVHDHGQPVRQGETRERDVDIVAGGGCRADEAEREQGGVQELAHAGSSQGKSTKPRRLPRVCGSRQPSMVTGSGRLGPRRKSSPSRTASRRTT